MYEHADLAIVGSSKTVTLFNIAGNHHRLHLPRTLHDEIALDAVTGIIDLMAGHPFHRFPPSP